MKKALFALFLLAASTAKAQVSPSPVFQWGGNIMGSSASCVVPACVGLPLPSTAGSAAVTTTGTWSGTIVLEDSSDYGKTYATLASLTGNVTAQQYSMASITNLRARASSWSSGNASIAFNISTAPFTSGGNVSWSDVTGLPYVDPTQPPYNVKADARIGADGQTTNGQPTLDSATLNCSAADDGKVVIVVNGSAASNTHAYPFGTSTVTQVSCNSATEAVLSANATQSTSSLNWAIGTDWGATLHTASDAAWSANTGIALPCGGMILNGTPPFVSAIDPSTWIVSAPVAGCLGSNMTTFILGPQAAASATGSGVFPIFYKPPTLGGYCPNGCTDYNVTNVRFTALDGAIANPNGAQLILFEANGSSLRTDDIQIQGIYTAAGSCRFVYATSGENYHHLWNAQNSSCAGFHIGGQGMNTITDSIVAFLTEAVLDSSGGNALYSFVNDYLANDGGAGDGVLNLNGGGNTVFFSNSLISGNASGDANIVGANATDVININNSVIQGTSVASIFNVARVNASNTNFSGGSAPTVQSAVFNDEGGNSGVTIGTSSSLIADGHSVSGVCSGTASASATLGLYGTGPNVTTTACTGTTIGTGVPVQSARTLSNLVVTASNAGVSSSSGVVTVLVNGSASSITCTIGTSTSCKDITHSVSLNAGDRVSIEFTTQGSETLAGVAAIVEWN